MTPKSYANEYCIAFWGRFVYNQVERAVLFFIVMIFKNHNYELGKSVLSIELV